eukprot:767383-Hanusia_phi.AAC.1
MVEWTYRVLPQTMSFKIGQAVLLHGLQSAPQYNGETALVNDFLAGKVEVKLATGKTILVRPERLKLLDEDVTLKRRSSSSSNSRTPSPETYPSRPSRDLSPHRRRSEISYREYRKSL